MMGEKNDAENTSVDQLLLPGFRFHPTDEELVGFYLKRKLQQRALPIELIKQVDIYKFDPWDLPKLSSTGEKEWYFYCPRDRKYRNSTRPNRVTGSGFWKATGTDRPIYSSDRGKCIGLKKSLVFYRGRAARGMKTDWMMHEFRLPATTNGFGASTPGLAKKIMDHSLPPNESWAICRIFKKMNSMANRALSHSLPDAFPYTSFNPQTIENDFQMAEKPSIFTPDFPGNLVFSQPDEAPATVPATGNTSTPDQASMLFNPPPPLPGCKEAQTVEFESAPQHLFNDYYTSVANSSQALQAGISPEHDHQTTVNVQTPWDNIRSMGFPFSLPSAELESWGPDLLWDSSPQCGSDISSNAYSAN